ncbi:MAG: hydroxyacid dehydrogenase [Ferruginibacter sp.]|nr:hydroxyacid dehydrogenase [Ferruginibacter sp.]
MIIITAPVHPVMIETFEKHSMRYLYVPDIDNEELYSLIEGATGLVVATRRIDQKMIAKAVRLEWIGRLGSGMEIIDVAFAKARNIQCISSPEGNRRAVAEQALGMLLSLMHNIRKSADEVRSGKWLRNENRGTELGGKVVGIIGFGNTGSEFARLLSSFDVKVLALDKYKSGYGDQIVKEASLDEILTTADIISFHLPYNEETKYFGDESFFKKLTRKPILINTSRGKIIKTTALIEALKSDQISGAALDVLENEQLDSYNTAEKEMFDFLTEQPNVLVTPHVGGYSFESFYKMSAILLEKLGIADL